MLHTNKPHAAVLLFSLLLMAASVNAQTFTQKLLERTSVNLSLGIANYGGDLQQRKLTLKEAGLATGIGLSYALSNRLHLRGEYLFAKIGADDKQNTNAALQARNLNFKANLFETALTLQYDLFDIDQQRITPYVYAGIAYFKASPYTYDANGTKYYLAGLSTEGQGLPQYPDKKPYSTKHISIPFGAGIRMKLTDIIGVSFETGFRKTFTDYIDDVSGTYADYATLQAYNSVSAALAYRGNEIKSDATYPPAGTIRGNSNNKDYYYFGLIKLNVGLQFLNKGGIGCPRNVL